MAKSKVNEKQERERKTMAIRKGNFDLQKNNAVQSDPVAIKVAEKDKELEKQ